MTLNKRLIRSCDDGRVSVICFLKGPSGNYIVELGNRKGNGIVIPWRVSKDEGNMRYREYRSTGYAICDDDEELKRDWLGAALRNLAIFGVI